MYRGFIGTVFSHFLSLLSTLWAIFYVRGCGLKTEELICIRLALILVLVNSFLALFRYGSSNFGYKLRKFHVITVNVSAILSFTILEAVLHHIYKSPLICLYLSCLNIIPFIVNISAKDYRTKFKLPDAVIALNGLALILSFLFHENYNGVALSLSYLFGYFFIGDSGCFWDTELPSVDAFQYLQCFLNFFTMATFCD